MSSAHSNYFGFRFLVTLLRVSRVLVRHTMLVDMPGHTEEDDRSNDHGGLNKPCQDRTENNSPDKDCAEVDHKTIDYATKDRRRSPRFSCGGSAEIVCLPSTGIIVPGTIRDLSLHGCWVDTSLPIECGARAEVVLRVNSASFRALGEIRAIRGKSGSGVEFVRLSANGKDMLADLVTDLARLQALMSKLKSDRRAMDAELFIREMGEGRLRGATLRDRFFFLRTILPTENAEGEKTETAGTNAIREERLVVPIDLFG